MNGFFTMPRPVRKPFAGMFASSHRLTWALPFLAVLLPVILLAVYSFRTASQSVKELVEDGNFSAVENLSELVVQDILEGVSVAHALASIPGTVRAHEERDEFTLRSRLKAMVVSYTQLDRAFITDRDGRVTTEYPRLEKAYRTDFAGMEWFREVMGTMKPTISAAYLRSPFDEYPVVAIAVPILSDGRGVNGVLVFEYSMKRTVKWLQGTRLSGEGYLFVVDQDGALVAHPGFDLSGRMRREYGGVRQIRQALDGGFFSDEYVDPIVGERMIATFLPVTVGRHTWVMVAQQPKARAYAELNRLKLNIGIAGAILTLFTLAIIVALANMSARIVKLNQELREIASIVAGSNDAIIGLTRGGVIKSWNASAEKMYGYGADDILGKRLGALCPDARDAEVEDVLSRIRRGGGVQHFDMEHLRKNGKLIPVSLNLSPVKDAGGTIIGASATARDITERREIERMKADFISFVSHQLKAPITAMRWTIESILDGDYGKVPDALQEPLRDLSDVNATSHHLVMDILNVSRIDRGVIAVSLSPVPLRDIAERAVRDYRRAIEKAGLRLTLEGMEQDVTVLAEIEKAAEAVSNAVSNAIKHTQEGGITVTLRKDESYGYIAVRDTGEGMPPAVMQRLFSRDQILGGAADAAASAGLGLYIAKKFMTLQNGDVEAASQPGKGSTFIFKLPLLKSGSVQTGGNML